MRKVDVLNPDGSTEFHMYDTESGPGLELYERFLYMLSHRSGAPYPLTHSPWVDTLSIPTQNVVLEMVSRGF